MRGLDLGIGLRALLVLQSERLQSLQAQVLRKIPAAMALAYLGRLSDFGFAIDGAVIKDIDPLDSKDKEAKAAYDLLARAGSEDIGVLLNRGHALLTLRRPQDALREFEKAAALPSSAALAWLGKGLARFMLDDFKAAEQDFRECLRLDPSNISAKINLAVTLSEEEQWAEAIAAWDAVLGEPLDPQERKKIEQVIDKLRRKPPRR